jgi:hypothetical protein
MTSIGSALRVTGRYRLSQTCALCPTPRTYAGTAVAGFTAWTVDHDPIRLLQRRQAGPSRFMVLGGWGRQALMIGGCRSYDQDVLHTTTPGVRRD